MPSRNFTPGNKQGRRTIGWSVQAFADASVWADRVKGQRAETRSWHYVNIPLNAPILEALVKGKKRGEVQRYHAILIEAWRGKVPFSTFKRVTIDGFRQFKPDRLLSRRRPAASA